jgi:hypothetical protein
LTAKEIQFYWRDKDDQESRDSKYHYPHPSHEKQKTCECHFNYNRRKMYWIAIEANAKNAVKIASLNI